MNMGYPTSGPYPLTEQGFNSLPLSRPFQSALIRAQKYPGSYYVLVQVSFDQQITAVIDLLRGRQPVPRRKTLNFATGSRWHIFQNVRLFDPARPARWRLALNGHVYYTFFFRSANTP